MAIYIIISVSLLYVCYTDVSRRKIYNKTVVFLLVLSMANVVLFTGSNDYLMPFFILIGGAFLSKNKIIGAGDIKLMFALMIGLSQSEQISFLIYIGLTGFIQSLLILIYSRIVHARITTVPYGVAIASAYWLIVAEAYI